MAKYRIVRHIKPEDYENLEPWEIPPKPEDLQDLDMAEIKELNRHPDDQKSRKSRGVFFSIVAVLVVIAFLVLSYTGVLQLKNLPDLGFLRQSSELSADPMVKSLKSSVVSISSIGSQGTGFNIAADGAIVTNRHVVEDAKLLTVTFPDGQVFMTRKWQTFSDVDLAILEIEGENLPCLKLAKNPLTNGDKVIFIGNPLGFDWTVGQGTVVNATLFLQDVEHPVILITGSIYPGSSGSPVFNDRGEVAAVVFASIKDSENTGLAIPIEELY
ncbi:MAG: S1C family serine protease [Bacillota bacterium]|jgi:serine protease Do